MPITRERVINLTLVGVIVGLVTAAALAPEEAPWQPPPGTPKSMHIGDAEYLGALEDGVFTLCSGYQFDTAAFGASVVRADGVIQFEDGTELRETGQRCGDPSDPW